MYVQWFVGKVVYPDCEPRYNIDMIFGHKPLTSLRVYSCPKSDFGPYVTHVA